MELLFAGRDEGDPDIHGEDEECTHQDLQGQREWWFFSLNNSVTLVYGSLRSLISTFN